MDQDRIAGGAEVVRGRVQEGIGRLGNDPGLRAEGLARQAAGRAQETFGRAKDGMREAVDQATDRAADMAGEAYAQGSRYVSAGGRELNARVNANPLTAIIVAGVLGYVLGLMFTATARRR